MTAFTQEYNNTQVICRVTLAFTTVTEYFLHLLLVIVRGRYLDKQYKILANTTNFLLLNLTATLQSQIHFHTPFTPQPLLSHGVKGSQQK